MNGATVVITGQPAFYMPSNAVGVEASAKRESDILLSRMCRVWLELLCQVSEEEGGKGSGGDEDEINSVSPAVMSPLERTKIELDTTLRHEPSYYFTANGTIWLSGFQSPIPQSGLAAATLQTEKIVKTSVVSSIERGRLSSNEKRSVGSSSIVGGVVTPMEERILLLNRLGEGATGVVYRAFDLFDLRLVAVKIIPISDQNKRNQLVHELSSLYDGLNARRRRASEIALSSPPFRRTCLSPTSPRGLRHFSWPCEELGKDTRSLDQLAGSEYILEPIDVFVTKSMSTLSLVVEYMDGGSLQVLELCTEGITGGELEEYLISVPARNILRII